MTNPTENGQPVSSKLPVKTLSKTEAILTGMVLFALKSDAVLPIFFLAVLQAVLVVMGVIL